MKAFQVPPQGSLEWNGCAFPKGPSIQNHVGVILKVLVEKEPLGLLSSLKGHLNEVGNLHYGDFGDRYFERLPYTFPKHVLKVLLPQIQIAKYWALWPFRVAVV